MEVNNLYMSYSAFDSMFNHKTTALSAMVIAAVLVASFFAISYVQTASAQGNMSGGAAGGAMNKTGNMTSAAGGAMNATGSAMKNATK
jgi:hypothetical protein